MSKEIINLTHLSRLNWLRILIVLTLIIGIFFRFINLDKKAYWGDETLSSLRVSGYTLSEVIEKTSENPLVSIKDLQQYQSINNEKGLIDTIKSVMAEEGHPPLYYVVLRFWAQHFGSSLGALRSLSAIFSLFIFLGIYWLCQELFESSLVGAIAISLVAVSPFFVLYAQEARSYSLWSVTILLSSVALLRAIRLKKKFYWVIYAITLILGLYTHLFTVFTAIGQGIYVFSTERFRLSKTVIAYLLASLVSFLAFAPWLFGLIIGLSQGTPLTEDTSLSSLITYWIYNICYIFIDFFYIFVDFPDHYLNWGYGKLLVPLILILVSYSIYFLIRHTAQRVWLFILITLIAIPAIAIILPDLIKGGYRSIMARYFAPCYLGILLSVAYLLAEKINSPSLKDWQQKGWRLILLALLLGGILSCTISSQSETWWNKRIKYPDIQPVKIINSTENPLVLTKFPLEALSLSHRLDSSVKLLILNPPIIPKIPDGFNHVFLLENSFRSFTKGNEFIRDELENKQNYKAEKVYKGRRSELWQLNKKVSSTTRE